MRMFSLKISLFLLVRRPWINSLFWCFFSDAMQCLFAYEEFSNLNLKSQFKCGKIFYFIFSFRIIFVYLNLEIKNWMVGLWDGWMDRSKTANLGGDLLLTVSLTHYSMVKDPGRWLVISLNEDDLCVRIIHDK